MREPEVLHFLHLIVTFIQRFIVDIA